MSEHENRKIGVLVMSYGTPESMDDVEAYYTHIRRGHAPTPELLAELKGRYEAIVGGVFPLRENTNGQVAGLQDKLEQLAPGGRMVLPLGIQKQRLCLIERSSAGLIDSMLEEVHFVPLRAGTLR